MKNPVVLKDAMYNFAPDSGASEEYCKGLIVGLVAGLMATGMTWRNAVAQAAIAAPKTARIGVESMPESWIDSFRNGKEVK
jgi:hypothetical protein